MDEDTIKAYLKALDQLQSRKKTKERYFLMGLLIGLQQHPDKKEKSEEKQ